MALGCRPHSGGATEPLGVPSATLVPPLKPGEIAHFAPFNAQAREQGQEVAEAERARQRALAEAGEQADGDDGDDAGEGDGEGKGKARG